MCCQDNSPAHLLICSLQLWTWSCDLSTAIPVWNLRKHRLWNKVCVFCYSMDWWTEGTHQKKFWMTLPWYYHLWLLCVSMCAPLCHSGVGFISGRLAQCVWCFKRGRRNSEAPGPVYHPSYLSPRQPPWGRARECTDERKLVRCELE